MEGAPWHDADDPPSRSNLSADERKTLERWARRHSSSQALATRCRIVLACADSDRSRTEIADAVGCNPATVTKWRRRFAVDRLDGLVDAPRPGAERKIGDDVVEAVVIDTLETAPADATHWSTRGLAAKHGISHQTVSEIWRAFGLKPWRQDEFKISPDPQLIEKIRDIVGLYMNPPVAAVVFAVDEKPQIQALNRTAPTLPMLPTTPAKATHDYERNGTLDLFAALDIATGTVITDLRKTHTSEDFVAFLNKVNRNVPKDLEVHVVLDNLQTHKTPKVQKWLLRHKRFHFHFTPTYGSWMNLVERWFSALTTKKLQRSAHTTVKELAADITAWVDTWNDDPTPYIWTKTADQILDRLAGYCAAITGNEYDGASA
ncbi:MAG: IS630 family transposase [Acidimicrobiales bacterium]|nr:IS630 family transposase [Acidimicrobiales bacterium]